MEIKKLDKLLGKSIKNEVNKLLLLLLMEKLYKQKLNLSKELSLIEDIFHLIL